MNQTRQPTWQIATSLAGKTAVITGVSSGIGRATALQFASAGATVATPAADLIQSQVLSVSGGLTMHG